MLEQLTKISLSRKIVVLAVIVVLVGLAYWWFWYSPLSEQLDSLKNEYAALQTQKRDAERRKSTYDKDRHKRDELKKSYGQQLKALPADSEMSSFLNNLNAQAELVGLELLSVTPKREEAAEHYARIPVALKLKGNFHQLAKFFYLVGNLDRIINIENISLTLGKTDGVSILLEAKVLATTFRSVGKKPSVGKKKKGKV